MGCGLGVGERWGPFATVKGGAFQCFSLGQVIEIGELLSLK